MTKKLTYDQWFEQYKPQLNHIMPSEDNYIYETYSDELNYILKLKDTKNIWTLIESDYNDQWIIPGIHIVNRMGYFVTENPWENENIEIDCSEHINISVNKLESEILSFLETIGTKLTEEQQDKFHEYFNNLV